MTSRGTTRHLAIRALSLYTASQLVIISLQIYLGNRFCLHESAWNVSCYMRALDCFYSPRRNNKFEKLPFRLPKSAMCDYYNTSYRKYIEPHFIGKTNFPILPPEGLCPIPKGNYWAKGVVVREDVLPVHIPRGVWRLEERFYRTKPSRQMVGGLDVYVRILDKYG